LVRQLQFNQHWFYMGNDDLCKVIRIRNIKIKMFNDVVRTLCDVRHIPNSRKNFISLGILNCNGFNLKFESGVLKMSEGDMIVIKG